MDTRLALYKHGHVNEDETMIDDKFIRVLRKVPNTIPKDHFVVTQEWDGLYWCHIENTEILA